MHLHILGICGTFMGGVAQLAAASGHRVTGCDANVYPPMSDQLRAVGIEIIEGYDAGQTALAPDVYVIGNAITRGNPLLEAILEAGATMVSGPQWVAEHLLRGRWVLAVAGTHGKTTTSAMLAAILDHADIFADLTAIETQFHHLVRCVARNGRLIVNGADAALARVLARGCWSEREDFGTAAGWHAAAVEEGGEHALDVYRGEQCFGRLRLPLAGAHNRANALAAIAAAHHAGVTTAQAIEALERFEGVKRRLELRGVAGGVAVYDDFAHHPTAIETTVAGLRRRVGAARILAVLEPRSNTMKLGHMAALLPEALAAADRVFIFGAREGKHALGWDPAQVLAPLAARAQVNDDLDRLVAAVVGEARPGDHVLVMSNGGFGGIHDRLLGALAQREREAA